MKRTSLALFAAALISPLTAFASPNAAELLPGQMNAAGFINVQTILRDYGMLFDGGPIAEQIDQFVAMGLPDPRTEIDQIAIGGTVENLGDDQFVLAATGSIRVEALAQFAAMQSGGTIEEEAYRGVTFLGLREPEADAIQVKAANLTDSSAMASFDRKGLHAFGRLMVDTAQGQNTSYAAKYGTTLGADDYATLSVELSKELRKQMEQWREFAFLSLITHTRGSLRTDGENVRLSLDGVCMDDFDAETVKRATAKVAEYAKERFQDPEFQAIIDTIQFSREGNTATVSVQLPEDLVRDILGGITGAEFAE